MTDLLRKFSSRLTLQLGAFGLVAFVCLLLAGSEALRIWDARSDALRDGVNNTTNLARAVAQHAADTIRSSATLLNGLVERLEEDGTQPAALERLHRILQIQKAALPQLAGLYVLDQDGMPIVNALPLLQPASFAERAYFQYHREHSDRGAFVGAPIRSRATGQWVIPVSRRFNHRDGSFGGVMLATIDITYFGDFYQTFDIGTTGAIALTSNTGTLLARRPFDAGQLGTSFADSEFFRDYLPKAAAGSLESRSPADGVVRISSYRRVEGLPLVVVVGLGRDEVLATWRADAWRDAIGLTLVVAILLALGVRLTRQIGLRTELRESQARLQAILDNAPVAISLKDSRHRYVLFNQQYQSWFGVTAEQQLGKSLRDVGTNSELTKLMESMEDRVLATGASEVLEVREPDIGTAPAWVLTTKFPVRGPNGDVIGVGTVNVDVSERHAAQEALREQEARYRLLADNATDIIMLRDRDSGRRLYVSPSCETLLGYAVDEMMSIAPGEIIHPDDRATYHSMDASISPSAPLANAVYRVRRKDGAYIWIETRLGLVAAAEGGGHIVSTMRDITKRKQAEQALRESEERFRFLVESVQDYGIYMLDAAGRVKSWNAGAERIKGYRADEIIGQDFSVFYTEADCAAQVPARTLGIALHSGAYIGEGWRLRKDGSRFWAGVVTNRRTESCGRVAGFLEDYSRPDRADHRGGAAPTHHRGRAQRHADRQREGRHHACQQRDGAHLRLPPRRPRGPADRAAGAGSAAAAASDAPHRIRG